MLFIRHTLKSDLTNSINQINSNLKDKIGLIANTGLTSVNSIPWDDINILNMGQNATMFFTNWSGNASFPENFGSGIILSCFDVTNKRILYIGQSGRLYSGTFKSDNMDNITWYNLDDKYSYPALKQFYSVAIRGGIAENIGGTDAAGVVLEIPFPCKSVEFTIEGNVTYGQYGFCSADATLPEIQTTGIGRHEYYTYYSNGFYSLNIEGMAARYVFITLNSGIIRNIRLKMV